MEVDLLTLSMGSGPKCDVEFLFIQDVIGTNTDRVPKHAKIFKDTNKSYDNLRFLCPNHYFLYNGRFPKSKEFVK